MFTKLSSREVDFAPEERTMRLGNLSHTFAHFLNARNELFHLGRFFIDVLQSTPLISKSLPIRIAPNGNLLLFSQIARNQKKLKKEFCETIQEIVRSNPKFYRTVSIALKTSVCAHKERLIKRDELVAWTLSNVHRDLRLSFASLLWSPTRTQRQRKEAPESVAVCRFPFGGFCY